MTLNLVDIGPLTAIVHEPIDTSTRLDPTTMAEQFEGDIKLVDADKPINVRCNDFYKYVYIAVNIYFHILCIFKFIIFLII